MRHNEARNEKTERIVLVATSFYLIFSFLRRLFFLAGESPSPSVTSLTIVFQLAMMLGLVGLSIRRLKSTGRPRDGMGPWIVLPAIGLLAGLGLLLIGMSAGELPARSSQSAIPAKSISALPADLEKFVARIEPLIASANNAHETMLAMRWVTVGSNPERRKLPRKDLKEFMATQRDLVQSIDRVLEVLDEPGTHTRVARLLAEYPHASHVEPWQLKPEGWRILRVIWGTDQKINVIVDAHWDEWHAEGWSPEGEPTGWQKEVSALSSEAAAAKKEFDAFSATASVDASAPKPTPSAQQ